MFSRPDLAILLAVVASEWSRLESLLGFCYATLLGKYLPHNQRKGPPAHPIGIQIFDSLGNLAQRKDLLIKLSDHLLSPALCEKLKKEVWHSIQNASKARNEVIHALWGISDEYPKELIRLGPNGEWLVYDKSDFYRAIRVITLASMAIENFGDKAGKYLRRREKPR